MNADVEDLAGRADRAMRTRAARATADAIYALTRTDDLLDALSRHRGWSRRGEREFVCSFGGRSAVMAVPRTYDREVLARLITRTEVNVFLGGGADDLLIRELQALAQRELERLFEEEEEE
ncbi:MAG TPA: hypothetical protein VF824_02795 [Thermoanaerobaculia bacterium]|jgi:hypothetical protein